MWMYEKENGFPVNYIYFGLLFFALATLQVYHVVLIGSASLLILGMYSALAVLESFIEITVLALISMFLLSAGKTLLHRMYLYVVTLLFFLQLIDFALVRLMDVSVWRWIELVFQETLANFIEMIYAANVDLVVCLVVILTTIGLVVVNQLFFSLLNKVSQKRPWNFSSKKAMSFCLLSLLAIGITDVSLYVAQESEASFVYAKALPWKRSLLDPKQEVIEVQSYLKDPKSSMVGLDQMDSNLFSLERKPDLFLFIAESTRADFLTEEVAPALSEFRKEHHEFSKALSITNGTHKTWFSLFYSLYPFYWTKYQPRSWNQGGAPLSLLKKMGYQINVYASSRLAYYAMDEVLFGKQGSFVDNLHEFRLEQSLTASETDALAFQKLRDDVESSEQKGGRVFIVFIESTHFNYSWPQDKEPLFQPVQGKIDYLELICARKSLDAVKNRYKNALNYVDDLFASFQKTLKSKGLWEDSVVVFTADHGEEFNENGCMFHASGLSLPQLQVPLYIKLGQDRLAVPLDCSRGASQMDIFPTLFHYLVGEDALASLFHGESLFGFGKRNYQIGARYNASQAPSEFYIKKDEYRMTVEFSNPRDIFHSRSLNIKSILDESGQKVPFSPSFVQSQFGEALDQLFSLP
jgi:glucan phosphoethanolaminetransferase (alkaline phosphatase superfamily)